MSRPAIIVVGAGFSGTLVSLWLQRCAPEGTTIHLVERGDRFGAGLAYRSDNPHHLLNVPAGRMGAFPDHPLDFLRWLEKQPPSRLDGVTPAADAFVPRSLYGAYLHGLLDVATQNDRNRLDLVRDAAMGITETPDGVTLRLASGQELHADLLVLATGHAPSAVPHPELAALSVDGVWQADPWANTAMAHLDPHAPVLLIGTGLTMVDSLVSLLDSNHLGPIHALSRHGLLPRRHARQHAPPADLPAPMPRDLAALMRWVRRETRERHGSEAGWHPVMEALRPVTRAVWQDLSPIERKRFRRHVCTWWDVHRHRLPPPIADRVEAAQRGGQLCVHAGRITGCEADGAAAVVSFQSRGAGGAHRLRVSRILNCTGPCSDVTRHTDPLMLSLLRHGATRPDPLNLGLDVAEDGALIRVDGVPSRRLFAVGPLTRGVWWEITAVPDIRTQCRDLAFALAQRISPTARSSAHGAA